MELINNYYDFCKFYDQGRVKPDVDPSSEQKSLEHLMKLGWEINSKSIIGFRKNSKNVNMLLKLCRQSEENFTIARKSAGIDFWIVNKS